MNFVAIDIKTANPEMSSICQIGMAKFSAGQLVYEWSSFVNPEDYFDDVNISIHGIESCMVKGQPKLPQISDRIRETLENSVTVCSSPFDRIALAHACIKYQIDPISTSWLNSARVMHRTWQYPSKTGYGLRNPCKKIGCEHMHHDALEGAKAIGYTLLAALRESQSDLETWHREINQSINPDQSNPDLIVTPDGNSQGELYGEIIVFSGGLVLSKREAADCAIIIGYQVATSVTKETTILVVGDQDTRGLVGYDKSSKHLKAEQLVANGHRIRIIRETDFRALVQSIKNEV